MRDLIQTTARLEFHLVRNNKLIVEAFKKIDEVLQNQALRKGNTTDVVGDIPSEQDLAEVVDTADVDLNLPESETTDEEVADTETPDIASADSLSSDADTVASDTATPESEYEGLSDEEIARKYLSKHPFTALFSTIYFPPQENAQPQPVYYDAEQFPDGDYVFRIAGDSLAKFYEILSRPGIAPLIPIDLKIAVEAAPDRRIKNESDIEIFDFYVLKKAPELTGDVVTDARQSFDPTTNAPIVLMSMNSDGADKWARITGANIDKRIAIVLDERVYSAPYVRSKIIGGSSQIEGMGSAEEARVLQIVLKAGALKAPVQIIEERVVGPSLGADSISAGFSASLIAFLLLIIYMALYYNRAGLIADFAVLLNILLILSVLSALGGTLTLPGIAGIILTLGMAVDANVLIFERIREELAKGRSLQSAIDEGFSKALSAILDSNITTGMTALILYVLGSGPVQGFAITLLIGILSTLFTAIVITRAFLNIAAGNKATTFSFGQPKAIKS
jgi:protein-export membrane protein SecD